MKHQHYARDVMKPEEVSVDMLPALDSVWEDTYVGSKRTATVCDVYKDGIVRGTQLWMVKAQEGHGVKRFFYMSAHGFLSRFQKQ